MIKNKSKVHGKRGGKRELAYKNCPKCGSKKHQLMACRNCGYTDSKGIVEVTSTMIRVQMTKNKLKIRGKKLTPEQERQQRMGFHDGAKVPGSNIRKIDK